MKQRRNTLTKVAGTIAVLVCGFIATSGRVLHAQQQFDLAPANADHAGDPILPAQPMPSVDASVIPAASLTFRDRVKIYEHSFVEPETLIGPLMGAGIAQLRDTPPEWQQGAAGYGRRFASGYGRSVISRTIALGVAAADHEDSRYFPSGDRGTWRRTRHALVATFVSRTTSGGSMPAVSRFTGIYGAAFIANSWEPASQDNTRDAVERGSTALLSSVGWHVFQEFWPDIRQATHLKRN